MSQQLAIAIYSGNHTMTLFKLNFSKRLVLIFSFICIFHMFNALHGFSDTLNLLVPYKRSTRL